MNPKHEGHFQRGELIYEGKAKRLFRVQGSPELVLHEFKDSLTAFNAQKKGSFALKGHINREISSLIFRHLKGQGVHNHWVADVGEVEMVVESLQMLKVEVVVRNVLAGSTAKRLGLKEGTPLEAPLTELYYKEDSLGDPFINDEQAVLLQAVSSLEVLKSVKALALQVNRGLLEFFAAAGLRLVDFKIELGHNSQGLLLLGDEISPDSCRLWDQASGEKMDKDRFRLDLGRVKESYEQVAERLKSRWGRDLMEKTEKRP